MALILLCPHLPHTISTSTAYAIPSICGYFDANPAANATWTLPNSGAPIGSPVYVRNITTHNVLVQSTAPQQIDAGHQVTLATNQLGVFVLGSDGNWKMQLNVVYNSGGVVSVDMSAPVATPMSVTEAESETPTGDTATQAMTNLPVVAVTGKTTVTVRRR